MLSRLPISLQKACPGFTTPQMWNISVDIAASSTATCAKTERLIEKIKACLPNHKLQPQILSALNELQDLAVLLRFLVQPDTLRDLTETSEGALSDTLKQIDDVIMIINVKAKEFLSHGQAVRPKRIRDFSSDIGTLRHTLRLLCADLATKIPALAVTRITLSVENTATVLQTFPMDISAQLSKALQQQHTEARVQVEDTSLCFLLIIFKKIDTNYETLKQPLPALPITILRASRCTENCQCTCHNISRLQSPAWMRLTFGTLLGSYTQVPRRKCNHETCRVPSDLSVSLVYFFPSWFLRYSIFLHISINPSVGPILSLRSTRILDVDHPSFYCASRGDITGLTQLFRSGDGAPIDVDSNGDSLLHIAVREGQMAMSHFLFDSGADPHQLNAHHRTPADLAWDRYISNVGTSGLVQLLDPNGESLRNRGFSQLHRAALGLLPTNVQLVLSVEPQTIDALDADGRTALYWAVRRRDIDTTKVLLSYGADIFRSISPLAWTCKDPSDSPELLNLLLKHGLGPDSHDSDGHTALHACGIFGRTADFIVPLFSFGAAIDQRYSGPYSQYHGITALGFAALYGHPKTIYHLLQLGANPSVVDEVGQSPTHLAVRSLCRENRIDCLHHLIAHGAALDIQDRKNYSAANIAMDLQDVDSLKVLIAAGVDLSPPISEQSGRSSAYSIVQWSLVRRQTEVLPLLLNTISILEQDPLTGQTVLHALAKHGNTKSLNLFEETITSLPDVSIFSVNETEYDINQELQEKERFSSLLYRIRERHRMDDHVARQPKPLSIAASINSPGTHQSSIRQLQENNDHDLPFCDASEYLDEMHTTEGSSTSASFTPKNSLTHNIGPGTQCGPGTHCESQDHSQYSTIMQTVTLTEYKDKDRAIELTSDPDSELLLAGWHPGNAFALGKQVDDDVDSGYGSDLSDYTTAFLLPTTSTRARQKTLENCESAQRIEELLNDTNMEGKEPRGEIPKFIEKPKKGKIFTAVCVDVIISIMILLYAGLIQMWQYRRHLRVKVQRTCRAWLRSSVLSGHERITWDCWCGKEVYADFAGATPQMLQELRNALDYGPASRNTRSSTGFSQAFTRHGTSQGPPLQSSNASPHIPPAAHLRNVPTPCPQNANVKTQSNLGAASAASPSSITVQNSLTLTPRFLELCINTGKSCQSLGEIDLTRVASDALLFAWVRKRYKEVRGPRRHWTHYLIKPVAMRFVSFGLENKDKVHIFAANRYPTEQHVASKEWHYSPCPLDSELPMPSSAFIHYLCYCSDEGTNITPGEPVWLHRLPKKLSESLMRTSDPLAHAFGLHIMEGPNRPAILWTMFVVLSVFSGPLVAYLVKTRDVQGTTGLGGMIVAALTLLWMAAKISEIAEE